MSWIIILLVILLIVSSAKKKSEEAKKREAAKQRKARAEVNGEMDALEASKPKPKAAPAAPREAFSDEGESFAPQEVFSGEGESPEEHAEHVAAMREREEAHREAVKGRIEERSTEREKLRAAIVMSELLDKPVALRPPRF